MKEDTTEIKKCLGCGSILQCIDEKKEGYIPKNKYEENVLYCQRCFKLINYNEKINNNILLNEEDILRRVNESDAHAFFLIDFLNISNETINTFKKITISKTLVLSKSDLIFDSINLNNIKKNIKEIYNIDEDIIFLSSIKNNNIDIIFKIMDKNKISTCYILGYTNAGKSTLINTLLKNNKIATSYYMNTTLDFIELNINDYKVIDTPGFSLKNSFYQENEHNLMKKINPKYFVSPKTYQTKKEQIFLIEDRLYLKDFNYNSITFYISNLIKIKKIYKDDEIKYREINIDDNSDIVIASLGFVNVKKSCVIKVNEDLFNLISVRKSILKK